MQKYQSTINKSESDTVEFFGQQCQNKSINDDFRKLHNDIINTIIQFCVKHNITIDEIHLNADNVDDSIEYGEWCPATDSCLSFDKFTEDYKDVMSGKKTVTKEEWQKIKSAQEPFLCNL